MRRLTARRLTALVVSAVVAMGVVNWSAGFAWATTTFTVQGTAVCASGQDVQGIYVKSSISGGGSGFAAWKYSPTTHTVGYFSRTLNSSSASSVWLSVGCGNNTCNPSTSCSWDHSNSTASQPTGQLKPPAGATGTWVLNALSCGGGRCLTPAIGKAGSTTHNPVGTDGYGFCTCGAAYMWLKNTRSYPAWKDTSGHTGDASEWYANDARLSPKWTETTIPMAHSLVTWTNHNHVGYVIGINYSTLKITYIDMNGGTGSGEVTSYFHLYDSKTCPISGGTCASARSGGSGGDNMTGAHFILAAPGQDSRWWSGSYPTTHPGC